jgi:hypothetical protein
MHSDELSTVPPRAGEVVSSSATRQQYGRRAAILLVILTVVGLALRVWRLGEWSFEGDEIFTLRDSLHPRFTNPRPLIYFLNHYLVGPVVPLDELGLRILPALFGVLAIPALYFMARRLVGTRAALFAALLLTFNAYQVHQSQYARYWSLVFLFSAIYPYALYVGVRDRNRSWGVLGLVTAVLAMLGHPTAVLLIGGLTLFLASYLRRAHLRGLWNQKSVRWAALTVLILLVVIGSRYLLVLYGWIFERPLRAVGGADHLLHSPRGLFVKQAAIMLSYMDAMSLPVMLIGGVGIYLLWQGRDRSVALLLTCLFIFPVVSLLLLSLRTAVSTTYMISTMPIIFIAGGVFLDRLAHVGRELRPPWLIAAVVTAIVLMAGAPTLVSQYRDGRRNDFRRAAGWLDQHLGPRDVVLSDQVLTLSHYLQTTKPQRLVADSARLTQAVRMLHDSGGTGTLWVVKPEAAQGGHRTNSGLGGLNAWIYQNCQLRNSIGIARLDFRQNELEIYHCSVSPSGVTPPATVSAPGGGR